MAGCVAAEEEADEILAAGPDGATLERWLVRREAGEPLAWITGMVTFCGRPLHVEPGVFVPRIQSEELARRGVRAVPEQGRVADLCTGAGAIAATIAASAPKATVVGTDVDPRAARCARRNGVSVVVSDLADGLADRAFDVVTAVAPYVPSDAIALLPSDVQRYEPHSALDGGVDGLEVVRRVIAGAARVLLPDGWLFVELGGEQETAVRPALDMYGFGCVEVWCDDDGDLRGVAARLQP